MRPTALRTESRSAMSLELLMDGARWLLAIVFLLSAIENAVTIQRRSARWHPVMLEVARVHS